MRSTIMTMAAVCAAAGAAMAGDAPAPVWGGDQATGYVLQEPAWASAPSEADIAAVYPEQAKAKGIVGQALMRCRVSSAGALQQCRLAGEAPEKAGFGPAALALAPKFRILTDVIDPKVQDRAAVDVPVLFDSSTGARFIAHPEWLRTLPADKVQEVFPPKAADAGLSTGRAVVDCVSDAQGNMTGCQVVSEDPAGMDFGPAALRVAQVMGVNPWTPDGHAADGAHVRFALRLNKAGAQ